MSETKMPAVEASEVGTERELAAYELAFHVLPTVAEGEVEGVFTTLKEVITKAGGTLLAEEAPERFDLAYEIDKYLEGRNRKFSSAYFGWIRFQLDPQALDSLSESVEATKELLRYLLIRLSKLEEALPFRFHEALVDKKVKTVSGEEGVVVEAEVVAEEVAAVPEEVVPAAALGEEVKE